MIEPDVSTVVKVPAQDQVLLGKVKVSEMVGEDVRVSSTGKVTGTIKYVTSFPKFSNIEDEQSGNYFPLKLSQSGTHMTIKKNGIAKPDKTNMNYDSDIILRVGSKTDKFTIEVDGREVVTLDFESADLQTQ